MANPYSGEASNLYYAGEVTYSVLGNEPRFLYAVRRADDGTLYLNRFDQLGNETWVINNPGSPTEDYPVNLFEPGVDYVDGRGVDHEIVYENSTYEQWRWDGRFLSYYINANGELVVRVAYDYSYPTTLEQITYP